MVIREDRAQFGRITAGSIDWHGHKHAPVIIILA